MSETPDEITELNGVSSYLINLVRFPIKEYIHWVMSRKEPGGGYLITVQYVQGVKGETLKMINEYLVDWSRN